MRDWMRRWWHGEERLLGLGIARGGCTVVSVSSECSSRKPVLGEVFRTPWTARGHGSRGDPSVLGAMIQEKLQALCIRPDGCAIAIPSNETLTATVRISLEKVATSWADVELAAIDSARLDPATVIGRLIALPARSGGDQLFTLIAFQRSVMEWYQKAIGAAGVNVGFITPRSLALYRGLQIRAVCHGQGVEILIDESEEATVLHTFLHGVLLRSCFISEDGIAATTRRSLDLADYEGACVEINISRSVVVVSDEDYSVSFSQLRRAWDGAVSVTKVTPSALWKLTTGELVCMTLGSLWERS